MDYEALAAARRSSCLRTVRKHRTFCHSLSEISSLMDPYDFDTEFIVERTKTDLDLPENQFEESQAQY